MERRHASILSFMQPLSRPIREWLIRRPIRVGVKPVLMGILNVTPDSFSGDGLWRGAHRPPIRSAVARARWMVRHRVDILDVGGESTRPGSDPVGLEEEHARVIPVVAALAKSFPDVLISVDTVKPEIAQEALSVGAHIINTTRGLEPNPYLVQCAARHRAGLILNHMRGVPKTMQQTIHFHDCVEEVLNDLQAAVASCERYGVDPRQIAVDPGIGFGKTVDHNLQLLRNIHRLHELGRPVLIGVSRKSFIGAILHRDVRHRQWGTAAVTAWCATAGVHIHRVHDVAAARDVLAMMDALTIAAADPSNTVSAVPDDAPVSFG